MKRVSFSVQPVTFRRHVTPFEVALNVAREVSLTPKPGTLLMEYDGRSYAVEEKAVSFSMDLAGFWTVPSFPRPDPMDFFMHGGRPPNIPDPPQVRLRNALMECKKSGVKGSQIQEIWDEFVSRQVLED